MVLPPAGLSASEGIEVASSAVSVPSVQSTDDSSNDESLLGDIVEDCPFDEELMMPEVDEEASRNSKEFVPPIPSVLPRFKTGGSPSSSYPRPPLSPEMDCARRLSPAVCFEIPKPLPMLPDFMDLVGCPCCHQTLDDASQSNNTAAAPSLTIEPKCRDVSLFSAADSVEEAEQQQASRNLTTSGVSTEGVSYKIKRIIVEGLLYKKGSGSDWRGSRGWKGRWTRLALGRVEGYGDLDVPLLCISWFPTSQSISTVIVLDSAVVLSLDLPEKEYRYRFEIIHAASKENSSLPVTRTFSAPSLKARDAWNFAISEALLIYSKSKQKAKTANKFPRLTSFRPQQLYPKSATRSFEDVFPEKARYTTVDGGHPMSPTRSVQSAPVQAHDTFCLANPPRPKRPTSPLSPTSPTHLHGDKDEAPRMPTRRLESVEYSNSTARARGTK